MHFTTNIQTVLLRAPEKQKGLAHHHIPIHFNQHTGVCGGVYRYIHIFGDFICSI